MLIVSFCFQVVCEMEWLMSEESSFGADSTEQKLFCSTVHLLPARVHGRAHMQTLCVYLPARLDVLFHIFPPFKAFFLLPWSLQGVSNVTRLIAQSAQTDVVPNFKCNSVHCPRLSTLQLSSIYPEQVILGMLHMLKH